MAGYKRKSYTTKRSTGARRAPVKRTYKSSVPRTPLAQSMLVSAFFEVHRNTVNTGETEMGYSIRLDPDNLHLVSNGQETTFSDGTAGDGATIAPGSGPSIPQWNTMKQLFNQYQIRGATCTVRCSREGSEFPIIISNDIGDSTPCNSQLSALSGAHKQFFITENRREAKYKVANAGQQLDFLSTASTQTQSLADTRYIKVFQHLPKANSLMVTHGVTVMLNLALKDSKHQLGN